MWNSLPNPILLLNFELIMSHFSSVKTSLVSQEALIQGLRNLLSFKGINAQVEVHDHPVELISDYSKSDLVYAQILIRRNELNVPGRRALLDVGFLWNENEGRFELFADPWDFNQNALGLAFGQMNGSYTSPVQNFINEVQLAHDRAYIKIHYPPTLWDYTETTLDDGSTRINLTQKVSLTTGFDQF
ncbi:MAG TPA: hypothetical protein DCL61_27230 [Cyanobacteria bacterium UBA12227]|nr:hypothetical protein [Cyanobacteria bacterium UBA12227]HAX88345.1 hypothetical protein [Cyanobacteria bacterium UBA11370]HBY80337.1 hypothetical protein [Cyanobacteria bacterium UBA11148]